MSHKKGVVKVLWHPREPWVITASIDRTIGVWDTRNGERIRTFAGHTDILLGLAVSRDGQTIVSTSDDHTARVYQI